MRIILLLACPENSIAFLQIDLRTMLELLIHPVKLEVVKNWASFFFIFLVVMLAFGILVLIVMLWLPWRPHDGVNFQDLCSQSLLI